MPDVSGPFTATTMGQAGWFRDRGPLEPGSVPGPVAATSATGELAYTTNGLTGSLQLGRGHVRGAYYERTGTTWNYTHPANTNPTLPRIDRVVLRRDLTAGSVVPAVLQGTPAATPVAPAPTQVEDGIWELPLHSVTVPANSGTVLTVADERLFSVSGVIVTPWRLIPVIGGTTFAHNDLSGGSDAPPPAGAKVGAPGMQYRREADRVFLRGVANTSAAVGASTNGSVPLSTALAAAFRPPVVAQLAGFVEVAGAPGSARIELATDGILYTSRALAASTYFFADGLSYSLT